MTSQSLEMPSKMPTQSNITPNTMSNPTPHAMLDATTSLSSANPPHYPPYTHPPNMLQPNYQHHFAPISQPHYTQSLAQSKHSPQYYQLWIFCILIRTYCILLKKNFLDKNSFLFRKRMFELKSIFCSIFLYNLMHFNSLWLKVNNWSHCFNSCQR